uniref:Uncharacterized protein n=1 Tax=Latimeria chalumnae TaxID=7897 RepID=H3AE36_LATCH
CFRREKTILVLKMNKKKRFFIYNNFFKIENPAMLILRWCCIERKVSVGEETQITLSSRYSSKGRGDKILQYCHGPHCHSVIK